MDHSLTSELKVCYKTAQYNIVIETYRPLSASTMMKEYILTMWRSLKQT